MKTINKFLILFIFFAIIGNAQNGFTNKTEAANSTIKGLKEGKWIEYLDSMWNLTSKVNSLYYRLVIYKMNEPVGVVRYYYKNSKLRFVGKITYFNPEVKMDGLCKWYYNDGTLMEELMYVNGVICEGKGYYKNGKLSSERASCVNGKINGVTKEYYESGKIMVEEPFSDGKINGIQKRYYESGKIEAETPFTNSKINGIAKEFYENGRLKTEMPYFNDTINGLFQAFHENGKQFVKTDIVNGKQNGIRREYSNTGALLIVISYTDDRKNGVEKVYFENGKLKSEAEYKNDSLIGIQKEYNEAGKLVSETPYSNGKKNGTERSFYEESGKLNWETPYLNNKIHGVQKKYYENGSVSQERNYNNGLLFNDKIYYLSGQLKTEIPYVNSKITGTWKEYYSNGILSSEAPYDNGLINNGILKTYWSSGKLEWEKPFINDKKNGFSKRYSERGKIIQEGSYLNDKKNGIWKEYDEENGQLLSVTTFSNDLQNGIEKRYYKSGKLETEATYANDKLNGAYIQYYENGKIQQQKQYKNGNLSGTQKEYYESGNLMWEYRNIIPEYNDKLRKYGIKNQKTNLWLSPPIYSSISELTIKKDGELVTDYFIATKNEKQVLISKNGIGIVSPAFDQINAIGQSHNLFMVRIANRYSFYQIGTGILKVPGEFDFYENLTSDGIFYKIRKGDKWYLFRSDELKFNSTPYDLIQEKIHVSDSGSNHFIVKNNKYGVIDFSGKEILSFVNDTIESNELLKVKKDNLYALYTNRGEVIIDFKYQDINMRFYRGFSDFFTLDSLPVKFNNKWGIINSNKEIIIPFEYDEFRGSSSDKNIIAVKNGKMGIVDFKNKIHFPFLYDNFERQDGQYIKKTKEKTYFVNNGCSECWSESVGGKWGMADSNGKQILEPNAEIIKLRLSNYRGVNPDYENSEDSTLVGYLWNIGGEKKAIVIGTDSVQQETFDAEGNSLLVSVAHVYYSYPLVGGKNGIVDRHGKFILPAQFDNFYLGLYSEMYSEGRKRINQAINIASNYVKENLFVDTTISIIAVKEKKFGVYTWKGKEIIPCNYDSIAYEYTNSMVDVSDSVFKVLGFSKYFFRVYKNGHFGYFATNGNEITPPSIKNEMGDVSVTNYDSVSVNENYRPTGSQNITYRILANQALPKKLLIHTKETQSTFTPYGEEIMEEVNLTNDVDYYFKGKFNLLNNNSSKLVLKNWVDDIIFVNAPYAFSNRLSKLKDQLLLFRNKGVDSVSIQVLRGVFDGKIAFIDSGNVTRTDWLKKNKLDTVNLSESSLIESTLKIAGSINQNSHQNDWLNYIFVKMNGKWFLQNLLNPSEINSQFGFDSVQIVSGKNFKGYLGGKFLYYSYKESKFASPDIQLEFPTENYTSKIVCKNCDYTMRKFNRQREVLKVDSSGERMVVDNYEYQIPHVKKGLLNLVDEKGTILLNDWASEILIPFQNNELKFSLTDTSSKANNITSILTSYNSSDVCRLGEGLLHSIALKYGNVWRLTTLQKQDIFIDGFDDIKFENGRWMASAKGEVFYYTLEGLIKTTKE